MYADQVTGSMRRALDEMDRRREIQRAHNEAHGITPQSITKSLEQVRLSTHVADARTERKPEPKVRKEDQLDPRNAEDREKLMAQLERRMRDAAANLEFEEAAMVRDQLNELRAMSAPEVRRGGTATMARRRRA
jgi:excinuclease ABC subunit B